VFRFLRFLVIANITIGSHRPRHDAWLSRSVVGLFPFVDALVDAFPSESWHDLGWRPTAESPLRWERDGEAVAWFERRQGPVRRLYPDDIIYRQPTLSRWVCTDAAWEELTEQLGEPVRQVLPQFAPLDIR
jgi:hypothetical protein